MKNWSIERSGELYNVAGWGLDYFSINEKGNVVVTPKEGQAAVDLKELVEELKAKKVLPPLLIRFSDILDNRIEKISNCFKIAAQEYSYEGDSFIVYPVKVNQMSQVVEEIVSHGKKFNIGLEAGSKPELHAVLAINTDNHSLIVCNGYKDEDFIELALLAQKMGKRIFIVVEKMNELKRIAGIAQKLGIRPNIGIRIKLTSSGSGKWEESGGDGSKFGLSSGELLEAIGFMKKNNLQDCFRLIHFHIGSQITQIQRIKDALREVSQFYIQIRLMGFNIEFVDIGGGLGVDYDGTQSGLSESSMNYSIQEYANDTLSTMADACCKKNIPQPNIIIESGRALTAHHSVLVFEVLETASHPQWNDEEELPENAHELVKDMYELYAEMSALSFIESWHDAQQIRKDVLDMFNLGIVDLRTRAQVERLYWSIAREVNHVALQTKHAPEELRRISKILPDKYFCNFSLFQSLPDSWAIDQVFPIVPISRLNERPSEIATLQDMTCDSDGKIDHFVINSNRSHYLPVHALKNEESYHIGVFMVGAYQEILGDLHNLFGDTNAVHISVNKDYYEIKQIINGESIADVLEYAQFNTMKLTREVESWVMSSIKKGVISAEEGQEFQAKYRSGLYGYTYLE